MNTRHRPYGIGVYLFLTLSVMAASVCRADIPVAINELLASNATTQADLQGQYDDWIELYNAGDTAVDLGGMYLTDDLSEPRKWQIPSGYPEVTTIVAQGHLLIWADDAATDIIGLGNGTATPELHAGFKLSAGGEEVALFDGDGVTLIDRVVFDDQSTDVSLGRYPDGGVDLVIMTVPTPGASNIYFAGGIVAEPEYSHGRGFYDTPFMLELTVETEGAEIYYTLDGRDPMDTSGRGRAGTLYTEPILIDRTRCVRAAAVKDDWVSSSTVTASYIFLEDVLHQSPLPGGFPSSWGSTAVDYQMDPKVTNDPRYAPTMRDDLLSVPSVSIVLSQSDFFGSDHGIYANLSGHGVAWERPASVEWIDPIEGETFQVNCGLRIHGSQYGRSSGTAKHSLRMLFKNEYGPSKLEFPLFKDTDVETFESLIVRAIWNYSWVGDSTACGGYGTSYADYLRDQFSRDIVLDMGGLAPHSRGVHVYVNGLYWGMYIFVERPDDGFLAEHLGGNKEDYDVLYANSTMETKAGDLNAWNTLFSLAAGDLSDPDRYEAVQQYLDLDAMIDFMLMIYYTGSRDSPVLLCNDNVPRNFYAVRRRDPAGRFVFVPWDVEWTLESPYEDRVFVVGQQNPHYLVDRLMRNPDFRMLMADHVYKHFFNDGALTPGACIDRYMERANEIDRAIVGESARWGDTLRSTPYTRDVEWVRERDRLVNTYFPVRTDVVLGQLRQAGFYPSLSPPDFYIDNQFQHGGRVASAASLSLNANSGTIWYTLDGTDPRVGGTATKPPEDLMLIREDAPKRVLVPTGPVDSAWRGGAAFDDSTWISGAGGVGYEQSTGYEQFFSIDVRNQMYGRNASCYVRVPFEVSAEKLPDLSFMALKVRYDDAFIAYLNGVEVARVGFNGAPAWNSSASFSHSDIDAIEFETFNLSAYIDQLVAGENVLALQALNESSTSSDLLLSVEMLASAGSGASTPTGVSLTAIQYTGPVTLSGTMQVKARALNGSTWSALNEATFAAGPVAESLRISELMYHPIDTGSPDDPNAEYLELTNVGADPINLNLVRLAAGVDFTFPSADLAPGEYAVVVRDRAAFEARYGTNVTILGQYTGSLDNAGERIELQDALGQVIHRFRFQDGWYDLTDGLGFSLTVKDPWLTDPNAYEDKSVWRPSSHAGGSPGYDDSGQVAEIGTVVVNELMAAGAVDWIELYNSTDQAIDISGWFLSDDVDDLTRYEIAAGTVMAPGDYIVFDEDRHFGNPQDPGCRVPFALSRNGETAYLHSGAGGVLTGYSEQEKFDASETGVSLGRYAKSTGTTNFVALSEPTPGLENAAPLVGPVVICEIMYNPPASADAEYVELLNISDTPVALYDAVRAAPWRFTDDPDNPAIELLFPSDPPATLAPGERLVLARDAAAFDAAFGPPTGTQIFTWGGGRLSNGGDKIQLSKPGEAEADGTRNWIRVDRVVYSDGSHPADFPDGIDPWPTAADGQGLSLTRVDPYAYGNDPANWLAADPSPGQ